MTLDVNPSQSENSPVSSVLNFVFEMSQLRMEDRSGWHRIGEKHESVAEHSLRAAQLGFILASMEGYENPAYVATLLIFHDMTEARGGDPNLVAKRYVTIDEYRICKEQTGELGNLGDSIFAMWREVEEKSTIAGVIAKDADRLEMAFSARELVKRGNLDASKWIDDVRSQLVTNSAKDLLAALEIADPNEWWKGIRP